MKIFLVGATGNTGQQIAIQALERGHSVTAIVRSPEKLSAISEKPNLTIVKCDVMNAEKLSEQMIGHDCVLSALGAPGFNIFKVSLYTDSMKSIIKAMRKSSVKKLICVSSLFTKPDPAYPTVYKLILRPMIGRVLDNMLIMEDYLTSECTDIDYTIVRPSRLMDEPLKDIEPQVNVDAYWFPDLTTASQIPRANVAKYMLDILEKNEHIQKAVAIDMPKVVAPVE